MALTTSAAELGFSPDATSSTVFGVLMDWHVGDQTASVVSFRDGSTSLYTTAEFGVLGGGEHESVRQAAARYLGIAEGFSDVCTPVTEFPYPGSGEVYFYLRTHDNVRRCGAREAAFDDGTDPTLPLFTAAQDVITALREVSQNASR